ncbi:glucose-1-phosphate thymidylyltransferase [Amycolatopsis cihanbeyliensis]|uniref:Glucose-1-phosphate thymidylyltransferase n=1 Tax=Amycolatopsis cihanbeyliensis TaxID=1128664 RepID=A0A542DS35_AMYCI|nr:glucose-1-phosphate thymidylyltransferase [Amycolatopsis cihanbeyliensis]TQJ05909.1 glucose-1-phosphate thymidylyltransferase [Amycolatopsis cihanbeyliensis]
MKALVLSGGTGTRLRPLSYSMPKQLIPVANKPVLEHVLENIRDLGVVEIGMIVGDRAPEITRAIGDGSRFGARITYITQDEPLGLAHCVTLAEEFLGDEDFVMYLGDNLLPDGIADIAREFATGRPEAQVVVCKVFDPSSFGVAELDEHGAVLRLVEKPHEPKSDLALIGVYFFTQAIHEAVAAIGPSARGELEITDAIQWLVGRGAEVKATEYGGYWKDTGSVDDVLEGNRQLLDRLRPAVLGEIDHASVLIGPVIVEPGARVLRSTIEGPAIIGAGTVVADSRVGEHTSLGRDCVLSGTSIGNSVVLDGSTLSGIPELRDSLIGRSVSIGAADRGTCHRLVLGDHTHVRIAA